MKTTPRHKNSDDSVLSRYEDIIQSMEQSVASNSENYRAWCVTVVAAILLGAVYNNQLTYTFVAVLPVFLSALMDGYYVALRVILKQYQKSRATPDEWELKDVANELSSAMSRVKILQLDNLAAPAIRRFYSPILVLLVLCQITAFFNGE
jgi:Na+/glutamate symporter